MAAAATATPRGRRSGIDVVGAATLKDLDADCMPSFMRSPLYRYILQLRIKEGATLAPSAFSELGALGATPFGGVSHVVKLDSGTHYVLKKYNTKKLADAHGAGWRARGLAVAAEAAGRRRRGVLQREVHQRLALEPAAPHVVAAALWHLERHDAAELLIAPPQRG